MRRFFLVFIFAIINTGLMAQIPSLKKGHIKQNEEDNGYSEYKSGYELYNSKNYSAAITLFKQGSDKGNTETMYALGIMYENGFGVARNDTQALKWFQKSADAGNAEGMYGLGTMYEEGHGVSKDYALALEFYQKSADAGSAYGMYGLGYIYEKGDGIPPDYVQALQWYKKSAKMGNADAMGSIGRMYINGYGIEKNTGKALYWYKKSYAAGNQSANESILVIDINTTLAKKKYSKAIIDLEIATENEPQNAMMFYDMGICYKELKNYVDAEKAFRKAVELKPDYADAYYSIGALYYNQAVALIKQQQALPLSEQAKYDELKNESDELFAKALPDLEKAHQLNPTDGLVLKALSVIYTRNNQMDKANEINGEIANLQQGK